MLESILEKHAAYLRGDPSGEQANLQGANLRSAELAEANLQGANLQGANLTHADLSRANLRDANLTGANLTRADLREANLRDANLTGANLQGANLTEASLSWSNLIGADLTDANLTYAELSGAAGQFITFQLGQHQAIFVGGYGSIGGLRRRYQDWLEKGEVIGHNSGYSDAEIRRYMRWIKDAVDWLTSDDWSSD